MTDILIGQRYKCILCGSDALEPVIDLGWHPLADLFIQNHNFYKQTDLYPLQLSHCVDCHQIQNRYITDPDNRYNDEDNPYSYTSGGSESSRKYWNNFAAYFKPLISDRSHILEIGSNDGYLVSKLSEYSTNIVGVDASRWATQIAKETYPKLKFVKSYFGSRFAQDYKQKPFDLIFANNVVNHIDDPVDFMVGIESCLSRHGMFIFEVPDWNINMLQSEFDTIYHEHISYFTATYAANLAAKVGLRLIHVEKTPYHGGSLRLTMARKHHSYFADNVEQHITQEADNKIFTSDAFHDYRINVKRRKRMFLEKFYTDVHEVGAVAAIGAAAKGNTILNYYGLNHTNVDIVTDTSEHKIGKFTPHSRIRIGRDSQLHFDFHTSHRKWVAPTAIILARNLPPIVKDNLLKINPNISFLLP